MANDEVNEIKDKKGYRFKLVVLWIGMIIGIIVIIFFLYLAWKNDDSEDKTLVNYIGIGISVEVAVISGMYSLISNHITKNEIYREKQESQISEKKFRKEQEKREDDLRENQQKREKSLRKAQRRHENILREKQKNREDYLIKKQKEFEEKWNQKKIDADLKAHARIEWIQRVREATSSFMTSCYTMVRLTDFGEKSEQKKEYVIAKKNGAMLILYFGPDKSGENQIIVDTIKYILDDFEILVIKGDKIKANNNDTINNYNELIKEWKNKTPKTKSGELDKRTIEYSYYNLYLTRLENYKAKYANIIDCIVKELEDFNEVIRRYLKTEWDRAKNNED